MGEKHLKPIYFTEQGIKHIVAASEVLKKIHIRLISEGYIIQEGKITRPQNSLEIGGKSGKIDL